MTGRSTDVRLLAATIVLLVGAGSLTRWVHSTRASAASAYRPLPVPLREISSNIGSYTAQRELPLATEVLDVAAVDRHLYREYVSQATFFTVGVGSIFEMPLVLLFLAKVGIVDVATLRDKRRHVIIAILVAAAMITPPDPLTQIIVAIPMLALYELSIIILKIKGAK